MRFLKNFRRGFATNSSSSHSFVYLKEAAPEAHNDVSLTTEEYSWEDFRLGTIKEKLFYVLVGMIGGGWGSDKSDADGMYEAYGDQFPELSQEDFAAATESYIDHESVGTISAYHARDPRVVLFGGNDNGGTSYERLKEIREGNVDWTITEFDWDDSEAGITEEMVKAEHARVESD